MRKDINHTTDFHGEDGKDSLQTLTKGINDALKDISTDLDEKTNKEKIKEKYKKYIQYYRNSLKESEPDSYLSDKFCELLEKWNEILGQDEKDYYKELLDEAFVMANKIGYWGNTIIPNMLEIDVLSHDDKEYYNNLLEKAFVESRKSTNLNGYSDWSGYIIPSLLRKHILGKDERERLYKEHLSRCFGKEENYLWNVAVSDMLKIDDMLDKDNQEDKKYYDNMLNKAFETLDKNLSSDYIELVLSGLIRLGLNSNMVEKNSIKNKYKKVLDSAFKAAETDGNYLRYAIPELLKLEVLDSNNEDDREYIKNLTNLSPSSDELELEIRNEYVAPELKKYIY